MPDPDELEFYLDDTLVRRPTIDQAKGVLVGTLCATPEEAHDELRRVAAAHEVDLDALAGALVETASGGRPDDPLLRKVVWQEWGTVLPTCD